MVNQVCCVKKSGVFNGKCEKNVQFPGCWRYCTQSVYPCKKGKLYTWYSRRCGTGYDTISYKGPGGNPQANGFASVLFTKKAPVWIFADQADRYHKGPKCCPNRSKGHKKSKACYHNNNATPVNSTLSKSTIPVFNSFEDVLAVRKTMAFYDPKNFKKHKKFTRGCSCKI